MLGVLNPASTRTINNPPTTLPSVPHPGSAAQTAQRRGAYLLKNTRAIQTHVIQGPTEARAPCVSPVARATAMGARAARGLAETAALFLPRLPLCCATHANHTMTPLSCFLKKTESRSAQPSGTALSSQFLTTPRTLRPDMLGLHARPAPPVLGPKMQPVLPGGWGSTQWSLCGSEGT